MRDAHPVPERLYLLILISLIVVCSLAPFDFTVSSMELRSRAAAAIKNSFSDGWFGIVAHFIVFFVLGGMVAAVKVRSSQRYGFGRFFLVAPIFCAGIEFSQLFLSTRHASVTDLFCNLAGVLAGGKCSFWCLRARIFRHAVLEHGRPYQRHAPAVIFILASIVWLAGGLAPLLGGLKMAWSKEFHLVVGNEHDGSRPWLGEIRYLGIYGRPLTAEQVLPLYEKLNAKNERESLKELALLAGYDFTNGHANVVSPVGLLRSDNLSIPVPARGKWIGNGGGILLEEPAILVSRGAAAELTKAIVSSGAFSVEAWVRPLKGVQEGPARILTLSDGIWSRNFMLAQEGNGITFRVRNGINGGNGSNYALHVKSGIQEDLQHMVAVYDHGASSMFLDGRLLGPVVDLRDPTFHRFLGTGSVARFFTGILLVLTVALPGYSIFSFLSSEELRHAAAIAATCCVGVLPYAVSGFIMGGPWRLAPFLWLAVALLLAYPICVVYAYPVRTTTA